MPEELVGDFFQPYPGTDGHVLGQLTGDLHNLGRQRLSEQLSDTVRGETVELVFRNPLQLLRQMGQLHLQCRHIQAVHLLDHLLARGVLRLNLLEESALFSAQLLRRMSAEKHFDGWDKGEEVASGKQLLNDSEALSHSLGVVVHSADQGSVGRRGLEGSQSAHLHEAGLRESRQKLLKGRASNASMSAMVMTSHAALVVFIAGLFDISESPHT